MGKTELRITTVQEKVLLEKHLPHNPGNKTGPTIELFFHELPSEKTLGPKIIQSLAILVLGFLFLITLPLVAIGIKLSTGKSVLEKKLVPGRNGILFPYYTYRIHKNSGKNIDFALGTFLYKTGLFKLPCVINMWKGQLNLVGPHPYPADLSNKWNKELTDYYKRFSLQPGFLNVAPKITDVNDIDSVAQSLKQELDYVCNPTFQKDLKYLLGI